MSTHNPSSQEKSVEQNLAKDYVPKSKPGNLPISNQVDQAMKKKMEKTQKEIEKFKIEFLKKYKNTQSVGIIPQQAAKKIEEEYEISEDDSKRELIHILTIVPESQYKKIGQIKLDAIEIAKKINDKLWVHIMTPIDFWNLGLDSKFEVMEALAMSYPLHDKGFLGSVRVAQIHKSLVLKKFEKYVTSYVIGGSLTRGETIKTSDIDVFIVIDDTDVKRMPRMELKEKLRGIIYSYIGEAEAISGVKNKLSPQIYLMTEFWEAVKDAHPVMFSFIRDGIPLYDRGAFLPWKSLLRMGKIKPSPEAIDMFMSSGDKIKEIIDKKLFDIATLDLFWGISTPTQGLLMLYGQAPGNVYDTVKAFRETFVTKEKLIEKKYADILDNIAIKHFKAMEHGKIKPGDIKGEQVDKLRKDALDYIARLKELREQIEKRIQEKSIEQIYKDTFGMVGSLLKKKSEATIISEFDKKIIQKGKFPPRFLTNLKFIAKTRRDIAKTQLEKKKTTKKKDNLTFKQSQNVDQARKHAAEITTALIEHTQRCELASLEKSRFQIKSHDTQAEVFFLKNTFLVQPNQIQKISKDKLIKSTPKELQEQITTQGNKETKIDHKSLSTLHKIFGEFDLVY
ncbi:nucleotidyltransferase domain-containing protein [archaeon]|jgi:predicted nucleotidyltransferase|nr:nucleotidyltransferase domain-containing protein [archaeon]MBT7128449.1 nucleotidyltransferase domain-containing protein [archaeon]